MFHAQQYGECFETEGLLWKRYASHFSFGGIGIKQSDYFLVDDACCSRTLCWKTPRLHLENKPIPSQPASFCWWELRRSQDNISWACMGHSRGSCTAKGFFCAWKAVSNNNIVLKVPKAYLYSLRFSVLPAISLEKGILHCEIVEGSFHADTFAIFIQNLLDHVEPFPGPNSVIVMDNCRIHKSPFIQEMIRARYVVWCSVVQYWQSNLQRCSVRISATLLSGLQPDRTGIFVHEVLPPTSWRVCSPGHDYNDRSRSLL